MVRTILGILVTAIVLYLGGFLYWGPSPYRTMIWKQATDEEAASAALKEQFPQNGTYYVPGFRDDPAVVEARFQQGPVAFVHILAVDGRPLFDPTIMAGGFVLNLIVIVLIAIILRRTLPACPTYASRVKLALLCGLAAAVLIDGGEIVWWQLPWAWKLYQGVYSFSFWLLSGLILAGFIRPEKQPK